MASHQESPDLAAELRMAAFRLTRRLRAQRAVDSMPDGHLVVLATLQRGPRTLGELAEAERVTPPSMNRTVNALEEAGYLTRTPDVQDRRKVIIEITDAGRTLILETQRRRDAWMEDALADLSPAERAALAAAVPILRQVADR